MTEKKYYFERTNVDGTKRKISAEEKREEFCIYAQTFKKEKEELYQKLTLDSSILNDESFLEKIIKKTPLFVIHPGWKYSGKRDDFSINYMNKFQGYENYILKIKQKVNIAVSNRRAVFVFYDVKDKKGLNYTKSLFKNNKDIIFVPSMSSYNEKEYDEEFFKKMSNKINTVEICGEWTGGCLNIYISYLKKHFKIEYDEELFFPKSETKIKN
jgi:hypothetical protein